MSDTLLAKYGTSRGGHALFAPSGAAGWLSCDAYVLVNARSKDSAGVDAAYGTVAHSLAESWHKNGGAAARSLVGLTVKENGFDIAIDQVMFDHVGRYVQWCREVPGDHYYEQRVDLSEIMPIPGQGGTADHFACEPFKLTITDLKMGTGVRVFAERNPQAMLYALGVFFEWDWIYGFQTITIRICQPRLDVFETWECSRAELLEFAEFARVKALDNWNEGAARSPTPKGCQWCAGAANCPARMREFDNFVNDTFDDLCEEDRKVTLDAVGADKPPVITPDHLTPTEHLATATLAATLKLRKHVEKWFGAIAKELLRRAEQGEPVPGFKLTDGRTKRYFDDAPGATASAVLLGLTGQEIAPPKMLTPSKLEALAAKKAKMSKAEAVKWFKPYVGKVAAKRTLASDKDERADVFKQAEDGFETEDEDEM